MAKKTKKLEETAYHEAGHAVMAIHQRVYFHYVTIEPEADSLGHIFYGKWRRKFKPAASTPIDFIFSAMTLRQRDYVEKHIMVSLAGQTAGAILRGRNNWRGGTSDREHAIEYASAILARSSGKMLEAYLRYMFVKTEEALRIPLLWKQVEALAKELLRKKKIDHKTVRKIMKRPLK